MRWSPNPSSGGSALGFLVALYSGYLAVLAMALLGAAALGWLCLRHRRSRGRVRLALARGLILCLSLLVGLGLAEVSAAIWLGWTHRVPDLADERSG